MTTKSNPLSPPTHCAEDVGINMSGVFNRYQTTVGETTPVQKPLNIKVEAKPKKVFEVVLK